MTSEGTFSTNHNGLECKLLRVFSVLAVLAAAFCPSPAAAATLYVDQSGLHISPYTNWTDAATNIQAAVDAAAAGDTVLVTNGTYVLASQISVSKGITVKSVNGAESTIVDGSGVTRCFYLQHADAVVRGFTVTNGGTTQGSGFYIKNYGRVENCIITGNTATDYGGCAYLYEGGILRNCLISGNTSARGGAVYAYYGGSIENCTIVGNAATIEGGGVCGRFFAMINTIVYDNVAPSNPDWMNIAGMTAAHCCSPLMLSGSSNITRNPVFVDAFGDDYRLQPGAPCVNAGTNVSWMAVTDDLDGQPRMFQGTADMGAYESSYTGLLAVVTVDGHPAPHGTSSPLDYGSNTRAVGITFTNSVYPVISVEGASRYTCVGWSGSGSVPASGDTNVVVFTLGTNSTLTWNWSAEYILAVATNGVGVIAYDGGWHTSGAEVRITPQPLNGAVFTGWSGDVPVGHELDNPLDLTMDRARSVIANFHGGTRFVDVNSTNPVAPFLTWETAAANIQDAVNASIAGDTVLVTNGTYALTSQINVSKGITVKSVNGAASTIVDGNGVTRCFYLQHADAVVRGFTVTNGRASQGSGFYFHYDGSVENCIITANTATDSGGGVCLYYGGALRSCLVSRNAGPRGGGAYGYRGGRIENCTIADNTATTEGGGVCGINVSMINTIVYNNMAPSGPDWRNYSGMTADHCCSLVMLSGSSNITLNPVFVDAPGNDYRLQPGSPCVNAGTNASWMIGAEDLDGHPRMFQGTADMGAYESSYTGLLAVVTVDGYPAPHGTSAPLEYGSNARATGITLTNSVSPAISVEGASRYTCIGWSGSGSVPVSGDTNVVVFSLDTDSTLTWNWSTEYFLAVATNGEGVITHDGGWCPEGTMATLTAVADTDWHRYFVNWTGTGLDGSDTNPVLHVAMDQPRTVAANFITEQVRLVVSSDRSAVMPPAGSNLYDFGDTLQATAAASQIVNGTTQYVCIGWTGTGCVPSSGTGTNTGLFVLTNDSAIVWMWDANYWLGASVAGCGQLNATSAWHASGAIISISAEPLSGAVFTGWSGDVPVGRELDNPLDLAMDRARAVTAHFYGGIRFVDTSGTNPVSPFLSWETAATNIQAAIDVASPGDTVLVANGMYVLTSQISVSKGITVESVNGADDTIIDGSAATRCLYLQHSNAVVRGFTVTNGSADDGAGVYINGHGMVADCRIIGNASSGNGGGAYLNSGGLLRNSLVLGNETLGLAGHGGGIYCYEGGTVESCTVTANQAFNYSRGGGIVNRRGTVRNTITWGNASREYQNYYIMFSATTENVFQVDPQFVDTNAGDFRLKTSSGCIDAGANKIWMVGEKCLGGNPRVMGGRVDIGAYEAEPSGFDLDPWFGDQPLEVTFTSYASLTNMANAYYLWDFNNDGTWDQESYDLGVATNTYRQAGVYGVALKVTNSDGEQIQITKLDCVTVRQTLHFNASPSDGANSLESVLTAHVTWTNQTGLTYSWDFDGDGHADTSGVGLAVVTNVFPVGLHTVSVTASNSSGTVATTVSNACVNVVWDPIIPGRIAGAQPLEVVFSSFIPLTNMANAYYMWDFDNDGTWDLEGLGLSTVTNTYLRAGVYSVSLTVTNDSGERISAVDSNCVTVSQTLFLNASPAYGTNLLESVLTAHVTWSNQAGLAYSWDFDGDGHAETSGVGLAVVTNVFPVGLHTVSVTASNSSGTVATTVSNACVNVVIVELNEPLLAGFPWRAEGDWEIGMPLSGPMSGYLSTNVAATGLDRKYGNNARYRLISPGIELPLFAGGNTLELLQLRYYEWFAIEAGFDFGRTLISTNNGGSWTVLSSVTGTSDWRKVVIDLSGYNGSVVMIAFEFQSDESITADGWFIDDVRIAHDLDTFHGPDALSAEIASLSSHLFPYVYLNVSVSTNGSSIDSLSKTNFAVYEDGILQTRNFDVIKPSENGNVRLVDIVFVMDNSGSMSEEQAQIRANVHHFVAQIGGRGVDFALGLCRYGQSANGGNPIIEDGGILTSDVDYFKDVVWSRNRVDGGYEPGYLALQQVARMFNFRAGSQKTFIIITDETPNQGGPACKRPCLPARKSAPLSSRLPLQPGIIGLIRSPRLRAARDSTSWTISRKYLIRYQPSWGSYTCFATGPTSPTPPVKHAVPEWT